MSDSNFDVHTPEFLNTLKCCGVPDHEIILKGTLVMLVITRLRNKIIEAKVLTRSSAVKLTLITGLSLTPSDTRLSFNFQR
ncbi:hypothetical protein ACS0TY_012963 [Phlomoides rotata]